VTTLHASADGLRYEDTRDLLTQSGAVFSADEAYRYLLTRSWLPGRPVMTMIMLNPSTATATADDNTIRRCTGFAHREGCGGLEVVNLFALRATNPAHLRPHPDPVGPRNDEFIAAHCLPGRLVVAAWGVSGSLNNRDQHVTQMLAGSGVTLRCFGTTNSGAPLHPLYLRADQPLIPYGGAL
jgi:hypothetical protein